MGPTPPSTPTPTSSTTPTTAKCLRCGHVWEPRTTKRSARCPACQSSRWEEPEEALDSSRRLDAIAGELEEEYRTQAGKINCRLVLEVYKPPREESGRMVVGGGNYQRLAGQVVRFRVDGVEDLKRLMRWIETFGVEGGGP